MKCLHSRRRPDEGFFLPGLVVNHVQQGPDYVGMIWYKSAKVVRQSER